MQENPNIHIGERENVIIYFQYGRSVLFHLYTMLPFICDVIVVINMYIITALLTFQVKC